MFSKSAKVLITYISAFGDNLKRKWSTKLSLTLPSLSHQSPQCEPFSLFSGEAHKPPTGLFIAFAHSSSGST